MHYNEKAFAESSFDEIYRFLLVACWFVNKWGSTLQKERTVYKWTIMNAK